MALVDWYFARGSKQMGPVSAADLRRLAVAGELSPDDLIWREGLAEWTKARNVRGLFDEESKPADAEESPSKPVMALPQTAEPGAEPAEPAAAPEAVAPRPPARHPMEALLDSLRNAASPGFVDAAARGARTCGSYGLVAAMVLVAAFAAIMIVTTKTLGGLSSGLVLLLLLWRCNTWPASASLCSIGFNRSTGGRLPSTTLPDGVALLSLAVGLAALLGSVPAAIQRQCIRSSSWGLPDS